MQDEDHLTGPISTDEQSVEPEIDETQAAQSVDQMADFKKNKSLLLYLI